MVELFANSGDPDQTPQNAASDLGLHCLSITLLGVSQLQGPYMDAQFGLDLAVRICSKPLFSIAGPYVV